MGAESGGLPGVGHIACSESSQIGATAHSKEDSEQYSSARHFSRVVSREEGKNAAGSSANVDIQTAAESREFGNNASASAQMRACPERTVRLPSTRFGSDTPDLHWPTAFAASV
jgi:hypothetical protein